MKSKMVWKLTACFTAVLLLFTVVMGAVFVSMFQRHIISINRTAMEEQAVKVAGTVSSFQGGGGMGMGMGHGGYGAYLRFLGELVTSEVWIVDENLNLLTTGHGQHESATYAQLPDNAEQIVKRVFEGEVTYGEEFSTLMDAPTLTVGAPIRAGNSVVGAVLLHSPVSGVNQAVRQGLSALLGGVVIALLLAGAAAVWLSYRFTAPLQRMKTAALSLAYGDYAAQTGVAQSDEIGQLAQTIDLLSDRLAQTARERAALDQLKQDFVANVSHELRTPVAVLRGSLEVLQDGTVSEPNEVADYYEQMLRESLHLERLVNDLLDLSRLQDAQFQLEKSEVNLCDVVRDTVRAIRRTAQSKQIPVLVACPEDACMIDGDYGRIRQLLLILLDNAVKFSPEQAEVSLVLTQRENRFEITVIDHGAGISQEELPHIFERFHKVHNAQNKSGTGLGLAIAKQIADRHGAVLAAECTNGTTCFSLQVSVSAKDCVAMALA